MRWILFDLVVGATLLWLVWGERPEGRPAPVEPAAALSRPASPDPAPPEPVLPEPPLPAPIVEAPPPVAPVAVAPQDRGRRLQALARDAETLFLRGRE